MCRHDGDRAVILLAPFDHSLPLLLEYLWRFSGSSLCGFLFFKKIGSLLVKVIVRGCPIVWTGLPHIPGSICLERTSCTFVFPVGCNLLLLALKGVVLRGIVVLRGGVSNYLVATLL